jgi:Cof subfamily protein (haloacid dehalogenase superfamily)
MDNKSSGFCSLTMKKEMIKLVLIDIDGTLVGDNKQIPERNHQAIQAIIQKNIKVTLVTGRSFHSSMDVIHAITEDVPVVFQNGAFIYRPQIDLVLRKEYLNPEIANFLVEQGRINQLYTILFTDFLNPTDMIIETIYEGGYAPYLARNQTRTELVSQIKIHSTMKIAEVVLLGNEKIIQGIHQQAKKLFPEKFSPVKSFDLEGEVFFEFFGPSVSKAHAVHFLSDHFQIPLSDIMFIGDSFNDIEALKIVGLPVAMGNAIEEVKDRAKFISKSNNEAGVAYAIETFLLKE